MIEIKPLYASDCKEVVAMLDNFGDVLPQELSNQRKKIHTSSYTFFQHWLPCYFHIDSLIYVAKEKSKTLGFIAVSRIDKLVNSWKIDQLVVHPDYRRKGIAKELINFVSAIYGSQGVRSFNAEVDINNSPGLNLLAQKAFSKQALAYYFDLDLESGLTDSPVYGCCQVGVENVSELFDLYQISLPFKLKEIYGLVNSHDLTANSSHFSRSWLFNTIRFRRNLIYGLTNPENPGRFEAWSQVSSLDKNLFIIEFNLHPGFQDNIELYFLSVLYGFNKYLVSQAHNKLLMQNL